MSLCGRAASMSKDVNNDNLLLRPYSGVSHTDIGMSEERPYYGDNLTPEQRSKTMRAVRARDTTPELTLRKTLRCFGISGYRVDAKKLPGRPDLAFGPKRLAVFVDGAFWHGRADRVRPGRSTYWDQKIARNQSRDRLNELQLRERGWNVLRLMG